MTRDELLETYELVTNFDNCKEELVRHEMSVKTSGLNNVIFEKAYDADGNELPNYLGVYIPLVDYKEYCTQCNNPLDKYYHCQMAFNYNFAEVLKKQGYIVKEDNISKLKITMTLNEIKALC